MKDIVKGVEMIVCDRCLKINGTVSKATTHYVQLNEPTTMPSGQFGWHPIIQPETGERYSGMKIDLCTSCQDVVAQLIVNAVLEMR